MEGIRPFFARFFLPVLALLLPCLLSCSFDYGNGNGEDMGLPDIVMDDVEYVRIRDGEPQVRFRAEQAERYEKRQLMEVRNFSFEQFTNHGERIDSTGQASSARIELDSGNIGISGGVSLSVDSEDIIIEAENLSWDDKGRQLAVAPEDTVQISRDDGTSFRGYGFRASTRSRSWEFSGSINGVYVYEEKDEDAVDDDTEALQ
jgi:LPS export ABC transporter protein LptC